MMGSDAKGCHLFERKVAFSEEFTADGFHGLVKPLDSYEEYLEARPLVEQLSRCSTWHSREYVEAMLRVTSYYPFVVVLVDHQSTSASLSTASSCAGVSSSGVTSAGSDGPDVASDTSSSQRHKVIGYMEVYTLPHLGRSCDSRLERVIVDPLYRNHGICHIMLKFVIGFCRDLLHVNRIDMICDNPVAIRLYNKFGFESVDTNVYRKTLC